MKIRIGVGLGTHTLANTQETFLPYVRDVERLGFDSLWLSERLTGDAPDPLVALAVAAGATTKLKLGTGVLVLPGRNPVVLAKEMASLDRLSGGRFLPAVGLGAPTPVEHRAFGIERGERAGWFDEALPLIRRLWAEDDVHHDGDRFRVDGVTIRPKPVQDPIEVWLGGQSRSELRRCGRLGDGWLPSFATVADVRDGWEVVTAEAAAHDREIDPEHLGVLVAYARGAVPDRVVSLLAARRPDLDPADVIPVGMASLRERLEAFTEVGASKFVVLPLDEPSDWTAELEEVAATVLPLES
ncbi:TIGR03619 family F420-dependent LLM class oxidoreductase [Iamia sp. SCSIO 61187]|uniref:TIGR03619 family F420-dependent LLM class oxidoreductase n=1 Tax=Iamia sp. SCSIO 61187 TaxID=2722752 RepID=UPI001C62C8E6|nr:TIGR03619 family F420-dependent LLM class oxidoreductase [Iamia sp. SCSIO 61187]QYG94015.1 TIGR03619 family F420-dependent LLM class oxidoreductase [Iamia sp. SCSIO 61187]